MTASVESYIIVRVVESGKYRYRTDAGIIRQAIHDASIENDIPVSDNVIRTDRLLNFFGVYNPVDEAKNLFALAMYMPTEARRHALERQEKREREMLADPKTAAAWEQERHRNRARRAAEVVRRYNEKYGDTL